ncbi:unnamed protein product, partial [Mesorhabditis belari]|uniref:Uncharacterized protein n=1 Tax=Mesorhabditis belari TaxID=2138241 RepID=A0AAF3FHA4_9BILA
MTTTFSEELDEDEYMEETFSVPIVLGAVNNDTAINQYAGDDMEMEICMDEHNSHPAPHSIKSQEEQAEQNENPLVSTIPQRVKQEIEEPEPINETSYQSTTLPILTRPVISQFVQSASDNMRSSIQNSEEQTPQIEPRESTTNDISEGSACPNSKEFLNENESVRFAVATTLVSDSSPANDEASDLRLSNVKSNPDSEPGQPLSQVDNTSSLASVPDTATLSEETFTFRVVQSINAQSTREGSSNLETKPDVPCTFTEDSDEEIRNEFTQPSALHQDPQAIAAQRVQSLLEMFESGNEQPITQNIHNTVHLSQDASFPLPLITVDDDEETVSRPNNQQPTEVKLVFRTGSPPLFAMPLIPSTYFDFNQINSVHPVVTASNRLIWPGVRIPVDLRTSVAIPKIPAEVLAIMEVDDHHDSDFDDEHCKDTFASRRLRKMRKGETMSPEITQENPGLDNAQFVRSCNEEERKEIRRMNDAKRQRIATPPLPLPQARANNVGADDYEDGEYLVEFSDKYSQHGLGVEPCARKLDSWPKKPLLKEMVKEHPSSARTSTQQTTVSRSGAQSSSTFFLPPPNYRSPPTLPNAQLKKPPNQPPRNRESFDRRFGERGSMYQSPSTSQGFPGNRYPNIDSSSHPGFSGECDFYHERYPMDRRLHMDMGQPNDAVLRPPPMQRGSHLQPPAFRGSSSWDNAPRVADLPQIANNIEPETISYGRANRGDAWNNQPNTRPQNRNDYRFDSYADSQMNRDEGNAAVRVRREMRLEQSTNSYDRGDWPSRPNTHPPSFQPPSSSGHYYETNYRSNGSNCAPRFPVSPSGITHNSSSHHPSITQRHEFPPISTNFLSTGNQPTAKSIEAQASSANHIDDWDEAMETLEASLNFYASNTE